MFHTLHETTLKRLLNLQALLQVLQGMGKILHEACGPLPAIDQRLSAVSNLLKGMELPEVSSKPPSLEYPRTSLLM